MNEHLIVINNFDIIIDEKRYKGTHGMWKLLTYTDNPSKDFYTKDDFSII